MSLNTRKLAQGIMDLKEEITENEKKKATLEGRQATILDQLEKEHGVKSVEAAEEKRDSIKKELTGLEDQILDQIEALKETHGITLRA